MYKFCLLFGLFFLVSCKNDIEDSSFKMNIDVVMKQNDSIQVFFTDDGTIRFNEIQSFWVKIKGQAKNQMVVIRFPKKTVPTQVRLDFGRNKKQEDIIFNKFEFVYRDKKFVAKGKEIYKYFRIDESNTLLNKEFGSLSRKDTTNSVGPSLYPNGYYLAVKLEELKFKK